MALILTVDDESIIRLSIKNYLEDLEHDVIEAVNGEEGLNAFLKYSPDLVLVDLNMPVMGGLELLKLIIQQSPKTPVIVISGTGILNDVVIALRHGAWNYLLKPILELGVLKHAIDLSLEKAKLLKDNEKYQSNLELTLQQKTSELASLVTNIPIGLYRSNLDNSNTVDMSNPEIARMFGYDNKREFNLIKIDDLFRDSHESQGFLQKLFLQGKLIAEEAKMKRKDGSEFWGEITAHIVRDEHNVALYVDGVIQDITERKNAEAEILHKAYHDSLTNLPNRTFLIERLHLDIALCKRKNTYGALLFIDLDRFKTINDVLGHDVGDELLIQFAERMKNITRSSDTIARLGSDEFIILLPDLHNDHESACIQAKAIADKAMLEMTKPFILKNHTHQQTLSIGIVTFPDADSASVHDLLKWADTAMYSVKRNGRNDIQFFHPEMQKSAEKRLDIEKKLQHHLKKNSFALRYQPQTNFQGNLIGAESLIRLEPQFLHISPDQFIPVAEETGLIVAIGNWVLEEAFQVLKINQNNPSQHLSHLSVNVSARQFYQPNFVDNVLSLIKKFQINPKFLMLEITESLLIDRIELAIENMNTLKDIGIQFSIDDFGTGFSSLAYLKRLPIDELKIDKSFIDDIAHDPDSLTLVKTIIGMAQQFNIKVVAEGVETIEQLNLLNEAGCKIFQGYYYSKPITSESFIKLISETNETTINFQRSA